MSHIRSVIPAGLNIVIAGFSNPQFSPDATRIYFKGYA